MELFMNIPSSLECHGTCCKEFTTKLDGKVDNVAWKEAVGWLRWVLDVRSDGWITVFFADNPKYCNEIGILLGIISSSLQVSPSRFISQVCQDLICQANDDLDAAIKTVRDMVSSLRLDVDARRRKALRISHHWFPSPYLLLLAPFFWGGFGGFTKLLLGQTPIEVDEILSTMRHDITSVETNLEESKAKLAMDTDHVPWRVRHGGLKSLGFDYNG